MKNLNKTTVILKALDIELKALLLNDLGNFKATRSGQKQLQANQAAWSAYIVIHLWKKKSSIANSFFVMNKLRIGQMK